jgi:hypothetical protein
MWSRRARSSTGVSRRTAVPVEGTMATQSLGVAGRRWWGQRYCLPSSATGLGSRSRPGPWRFSATVPDWDHQRKFAAGVLTPRRSWATAPVAPEACWLSQSLRRALWQWDEGFRTGGERAAVADVACRRDDRWAEHVRQVDLHHLGRSLVDKEGDRVASVW